MSAMEYLRSKVADHPLRTIDTAVNGLVLQPFVTKWNGFGEWIRGARFVLAPLAIAGLVAMAFFGAGRLVLVALLGSLLPYIFTWNVGGGGEWRFTMHAYPFFLVAVGVAVVGIVRGVLGPATRSAANSRERGRHDRRLQRAAICLTAGAGLRGTSACPGSSCARPSRSTSRRASKPANAIASSTAMAGRHRTSRASRRATASARQSDDPDSAARAARLRSGAASRSRHPDGSRSGRCPLQPPFDRAPAPVMEPGTSRFVPVAPARGDRQPRQQRGHHHPVERDARGCCRTEAGSGSTRPRKSECACGTRA